MAEESNWKYIDASDKNWEYRIRTSDEEDENVLIRPNSNMETNILRMLKTSNVITFSLELWENDIRINRVIENINAFHKNIDNDIKHFLELIIKTPFIIEKYKESDLGKFVLYSFEYFIHDEVFEMDDERKNFIINKIKIYLLSVYFKMGDFLYRNGCEGFSVMRLDSELDKTLLSVVCSGRFDSKKDPLLVRSDIFDGEEQIDTIEFEGDDEKTHNAGLYTNNMMRQYSVGVVDVQNDGFMNGMHVGTGRFIKTPSEFDGEIRIVLTPTVKKGSLLSFKGVNKIIDDFEDMEIGRGRRSFRIPVCNKFGDVVGSKVFDTKDIGVGYDHEHHCIKNYTLSTDMKKNFLWEKDLVDAQSIVRWFSSFRILNDEGDNICVQMDFGMGLNRANKKDTQGIGESIKDIYKKVKEENPYNVDANSSEILTSENGESFATIPNIIIRDTRETNLKVLQSYIIRIPYVILTKNESYEGILSQSLKILSVAFKNVYKKTVDEFAQIDGEKYSDIGEENLGALHKICGNMIYESQRFLFARAFFQGKLREDFIEKIISAMDEKTQKKIREERKHEHGKEDNHEKKTKTQNKTTGGRNIVEL